MSSSQQAGAGDSDGGFGVGGKIRKRPTRRPATPYGRPPTAIRNPNVRNGWLSKLVDPATRIISSSASRLFSSVFRKQLPPPMLSSEETNSEPRHELLEEPCINSSGAHDQDQGNKREKPGHNSFGNRITELEQLLEQKTFTRDESNRLTELLRSRTVDLLAGGENERTEPSTSQVDAARVRQENATFLAQANGVGRPGFSTSISTPVGMNNLEEAGSPAELAKAYMGSRPPTLSSSSQRLQSQPFREDAVSSPNMSFAKKSYSHFSGASDVSEIGYFGATPRGRSALYSMPHTPYSRGTEPTENGYAGPSMSSHWTQAKKNKLYSDRQVLKRRSSVLDDFGSPGPIRRIRQKSSMMSLSKDKSLISVSRLPVSDSVHGSTSLIQKLPMVDEAKCNSSNPVAAENGDRRISNASFPSVPPHSSKMARKILQQLDELVPSPNGQSSKLKLTMARETLPPKLTLDMLNGRALRSMEDVGSPKLQHAQDSGSLNVLNSTDAVESASFIFQKQDKVEENCSAKNADTRVKPAPEGVCLTDSFISVKHSASSAKAADTVVSDSAVTTSQNKRAFHMSAPEDFLEMDDDDDSSKSTANPHTDVNDKLKAPLVECKTVAAENPILEKPAAVSLEFKPASDFKLGNCSDSVRASDGFNLTGKDVGFTFPLSVANTLNPPHPVPTAQLPSFNASTLPKESTVAPVFSFSSKRSDVGPTDSIISSMTGKVSDALGVTSGSRSDAKLDIHNSNVTTLAALPATPPAEVASDDKSNTTQEVGKPLESAASDISMPSTPNIFSFGSTNSSKIGHFPPSIFGPSVSATASILSGSLTSPISSSSSLTTGGNVPSISASVPTSSTSIFKFGSDTSTAGFNSSSVAVPSVTSGLDSTDSEPKTKKASPFSISGSSSAESSSLFTSATSGSIAASPFTSTTSSFATSSFTSTASNIASSPSFTSTTISIASSPSLTSTVSGIASSPLFTSTSSGIVPSPSFTSTSSGIASSPSFTGTSSGIASSPPFTSTSSGIASSPFTSTTSSIASSPSFTSTTSSISGFSASALMNSSSAGINSQNSASGATTGSIFGTQATPAGSTPSITQNTPSEFGSTSSPPIFSPSTSALFGSVGSFGTSSDGAKLFSSGSSFGMNSSASFSTGGNSFSSTSGSFASSGATSLFGSSSQPAASSIFGSGFGSSSPATRFQFGASNSATSSTVSPFSSSLGVSSGSSLFPSTSTAATPANTSSALSPVQPVYGMPNQIGFGSASTGNDQMNVEDSMAEDTVQTLMPVAAPAFGQLTNTPSNFGFGFQSAPSGGPPMFQFNSNQNLTTPQNPSPFSAGNLEFTTGGSFSLGTGGTDKSNRKFVRARRKK